MVSAVFGNRKTMPRFGTTRQFFRGAGYVASTFVRLEQKAGLIRKVLTDILSGSCFGFHSQAYNGEENRCVR